MIPDLPTQVQIAKSHHVTFLRYQEGKLWYRLMWTDDRHQYLPFDFPIPVDDAGEGEFLPSMRGIEVLRWARKHAEFIRSSDQA